MPESSADSWEELRDALAAVQKSVARSRATHINTQSLKDAAKRTVQQYFRIARPELESTGIDPSSLEPLDLEMQNLLGLANSRARKSAYVSVLRAAKSELDELELARELHLGRASPAAAQGARTDVEAKISSTLEALVASAGLSYDQALADLEDPRRVSFRGTANELREALRETLDHLAPDGEVERSESFKLEKGQTRPSQKQKVRYILRSRGLSGAARKTAESGASLVEELTASVTRASFERSNLSAHIASSGREVRQLKMWVDTVLAELLEIHA